MRLNDFFHRAVNCIAVRYQLCLCLLLMKRVVNYSIFLGKGIIFFVCCKDIETLFFEYITFCIGKLRVNYKPICSKKESSK